MRYLCPILLGLSLSGCASRGPALAEGVTVKPPDTSHVMSVLGRDPIGHACPAGKNLVLTAAHVMDPEPGNRERPFEHFRWSDEAGNSGFLIPIAGVLAADLAVMKSHEDLSFWYPRAAEAPKPGDHLWLVEYDWSGQEEAFAHKRVEVAVVRIVAGSIVFKPAGMPGSSGSCVLNAAGEIVGIQVWTVAVGWHRLQQVGVSVGVWGPWFQLEGN